VNKGVSDNSEASPISRLGVWLEAVVFFATIGAMAWVGYRWIIDPYGDNTDKKLFLAAGMVIIAMISKSRVANFITWLN
jgi:hypothetical protein